MIFNSDYLATNPQSMSSNSVGIQGFNGERINDTHMDAVTRQGISRLQTFVHSYTRSNKDNLVTRVLSDYLGSTHLYM